MKKLLFLALLLCYALSLNQNYYQRCLSGIENIDIISVSQCRKYDDNGGYCCYLQYENEKIQNYIYFPSYYNYKKIGNKTSTTLRMLGEKNKICYGISKNGYDNINDVIKELKEETGVENLDIDCGQHRLKNCLLTIVGLFLFMIII